MRIDRHTLLFFDASCLVAAAGSPSGGSGFLLSLCAQGLLRVAVSQPVLLEAERNIVTKLDVPALGRFHQFVAQTPYVLAAVPLRAERERYRAVVDEKDEHVVTAAIVVGAPFLLTLDKRLAERVNTAGWPLSALSPGEFITRYLPTHPDYPTMR